MALPGVFKCDPTNFQVTDEMIQAYNDLGYFLVKGFLTEAELKKVKEAVENERFLSHGYGIADGFGKESRLVMWKHPGNDVTGMLARCQKVAGTCEKVVGGEVYHYHTKLMTKAARTGGQHIWHQDYGYWYKNGCLFPDMMISAFIPIDRCYKENGCLEILVGSHKCGRIEHVMKAGQTGADLDRVEMIKTQCPHAYVEMDAGDALFFHSNLLHTSGDNLSDTKRWVFIPCFNRKDNNPRIKHHHPQYTPLDIVPDSAIMECQNFEDMSGKEFNVPDEDKTIDPKAR